MTYAFPLPDNESERLLALEDYDILDTLPEQAYDDIARLAAFVCGVDKAMVAFVDGERKWHKARYNIAPEEVPRGFAICSQTIMGADPFIVPDTHKDPRVKDIGMVTHPPHVRFYAGVPLIDDAGMALGTLCAVDTQPQDISEEQTRALTALANQVMQLLRLRKSLKVLEARERQLNESRQRLDSANSELRRLTLTDELTGLNNRRAFNTELSRETHHAGTRETPLSLLVIDIDHFKILNDNRGHSFGDQVLIRVAGLLRQRVRHQDFCARYGGEEFVILLPDTPLQGALKLAEACRKSIQENGFDGEKLTISIGVAEYQGQPAEALFDSADKALLDAKRQGRNCIVTGSVTGPATAPTP
ncbi:sensor domain-containing diguanylate cyclase [Aliamphritea hakodatensis]|uniref:sensor domain-containing diguanylate cyclase n=1 Tax=Aliamphritea hakodatensis TaxID=2895352 RepID=UPI0022FD6C12|nr:sensor domain-containing diguanylate cyclase [Aliamphritea hakodatensis]